MVGKEKKAFLRVVADLPQWLLGYCEAKELCVEVGVLVFSYLLSV